MENFFKLKENGTTVRKEVIAGITTFFAMAYIVFVNPNQVAAGGVNGWLVAEGADAGLIGKIWNAVYVASILGAFVGTILMSLYAKLPFAQACGMGLNAFFCTVFVSNAFFSKFDIVKGYQAGLVIIFISGLIFLLLSITGARQYIAKAMPTCLKAAIPAGIGLFIAFIGFQNAGIIQDNPFTLVQFFDFNGAFDKNLTTWIPVVVALVGLLLIAILTKLNISGAIIISILISSALYYILMGQVPSFDMQQIGQSFKDFGEIGISAVFQGESWKNAFSADFLGGIFNIVMLIVTFCLVDMFDTLGTVYGTASQAGMLDEAGDPIRLEKAMMSDSIATVCGSVFGTSTVTTFVESSAGVAAGGRTGLTSLVTSLCFIVCLFLTPLASIIPSCATAPALIFVGVLMMKNFSKVDMDDIASAVPAFLAMVMMILTYSISNGIGIGCIAYTIITLCTGKYGKKDIMVTVIALLFAIKFAFVTM